MMEIAFGITRVWQVELTGNYPLGVSETTNLQCLGKKKKKLLVWHKEGLNNRVGWADFFLGVCVRTVVNAVFVYYLVK